MAKWFKALFSHSDDTGFKSGWGQNHFSQIKTSIKPSYNLVEFYSISVLSVF